MLHDYIEQFLSYCQASDFPAKSIEALTARLGQFHRYYQTLTIRNLIELTLPTSIRSDLVIPVASKLISNE
jgi:hypothetical protein